jgi:hypothetical protein
VAFERARRRSFASREHAQSATLLLQFANLTPGIELFEVGIRTEGLDCTSDLILNSIFKDEEALKAYQNHPEHVAVKPFMKAVVEQRSCMDFWV